MELAIALGCFIVGAILAFVVAHRMERHKSEKELLASSSTFEIQIAKLSEQILSGQRQIEQLSKSLSETQLHLKHCNDQLRQEGEQRAAAEEKAKQIESLQSTIDKKNLEISSLSDQFTENKLQCSELETLLRTERKMLEDQKVTFENSKVSLLDTFKALSTDTLRENSQTFIQMAAQTLEQVTTVAKNDLEMKRSQVEATVKPIKDALEKVDLKIGDLEKARLEAYAGITVHFSSMKETNDLLRLETSNLVKALRSPQVRGRWGEMQLRRVVEMAGMIKHCDFVEQATTDTEESNLRPDMIVSLPGGKCIVVDSKAVINSYIEATQTDDEVLKKSKLLEHARHVRERIADLSKKKYWDQFENSPDFVVLFLPGDSFFSAALDVDPTLIEQSVDQKVIIATPMTLIALLKAAAYGWTQAALAENAQHISDLGRELHKRISDMAEHFSSLGTKLGGAVESYNKAVGSLETRVLVSSRRFHELKAASGDEVIESLEPIEKTPREIQAPEMKLVSSTNSGSDED